MIKARRMSNSCIQCLSISKSDFLDPIRLIQDLLFGVYLFIHQEIFNKKKLQNYLVFH